MTKTLRTSLNLLGVACALLFAACASSTAPPATTSATPDSLLSSPVVSKPGPPQKVGNTDDAGDSNARALQDLWRSRNADKRLEATSSSFIIGPGDILRISLPQLDQMKDRRVRVSENDTIDLPLLGQINVAGMTQEDLHQALSSRVEKYVYKPQVAVYLEHTENRLAAVLGAVKTPGRYMLASPSDTIMTMISRAGGTTEEAASRIILIPAFDTGARARPVVVAANEERAVDVTGDAPSGVAVASRPQPAITSTVSQEAMDQGVVIDLFHSANERYLELPVRMGDVIIVPVAGDVTVQGWVEKPGSFKITRGMTVLSAIAAAGGALFTSSATLLREQGNDTKLAIPLNLSRIKDGTERDVSLQGGDVVVVERSAAGAIPYTAYFLINKMGWGIFPAI
ncbi:MAG TPA: polysaccharide biosynthesis/export family protein [Candidatus Binataceae bacterium]|nr:polysaccharide biosynthesis/export family protein [Candidatus Binataceae bacterium]